MSWGGEVGPLSLDTMMLVGSMRPLEGRSQNGVVTVFTEDRREISEALLREREPTGVTVTQHSKGKLDGR